ncbi:MAG: leucine-rich repeat domain-containing protein [Oscillospiraceae bacterium]|nr:leucine-rich repeat domain-containing protein [Oscillospiraceae bacterium]
MLVFPKKPLCLALALAAAISLSGCGKQAEETTPPTLAPIVLPTAPKVEETEATDPRQDVEHLAVVMTAGDLYTLEHYPNLKTVDLSGSTCYWAIWEFIDNHPGLEVTFTVDLGGTAVDAQAETVTLDPGSYDYAALEENLQYLPNLTSLSLPRVTLTAEEIRTLTETYPEIAVEYTVELFGNVLDNETMELDLSAMEASQLEEAGSKLNLLTDPIKVKLSGSLSKAEVDRLQTAAPHILFDYSFTLFGKTISTADEEVIYKKQDIGNDGEAALREALVIMDHCKRFVLDNCGFDDEVLAKVREDFRGGPKVIWRVFFGVGGRYSTLTDDDTIRAVYNVTDSTCGPMKYLEDVKYMDIGHNEHLSDLSFVQYMPELEVLIASESGVKELTGFDNCKKLTWLELAYCYKLENIDALAGCDGLKYLNISYSKVKSFEPLDTLELERFVYLKPKASTEEQNTFLSIHPKEECITVFYGYSMPYSYGWRYDDNGKTMFWYYKDVIRKVFNYDQADAILNAQKKAEGG